MMDLNQGVFGQPSVHGLFHLIRVGDSEDLDVHVNAA
jgi:hypothetical protein